MRLIKGVPCQPIFQDGCVLTIGNFDGVHLGHKAVVEKLAKRGQQLGLPVVVMIFEPQPLEFFFGGNAPPRLSRLREKAMQLEKLPVDDLVIVRFNKQLANSEPEAFIDQYLVKGVNVKHLVIGDDFRFGKSRLGGFDMLKKHGEIRGFTVEDTGSLLLESVRVSSTLIRNALAADDLEQAKELLGYDYSVSGRVVHGDKRGRTMGYPTANIMLFRKNVPLNGVFAVTVTGIDNVEIEGIANLGVRPTIDGGNKVILEVHLFGFNQDIYGRYVTVHFKNKIRSECRFRSVDELKAQIVNDVARAKAVFAAQAIEDNGL
jgi:riboflavin kinase / FMN adenylyltransferase